MQVNFARMAFKGFVAQGGVVGYRYFVIQREVSRGSG
jgi:hypothetical protein